MATVQHIRPDLQSLRCPAPLRSLRGWLLWRFEDNPVPGGKPRKVPYYAAAGRRHGTHGGPQDREQLTSFDAALAAAVRRGMDGVGLAMLPDWGVTALDFDACVRADGSLHPDVARITGETYAEWSPSGQGVRAFVTGTYGNRKSPPADGMYGFELFSTNGFVTVTGNSLPSTDLLELQDTIAHVPFVQSIVEQRFAAEDAFPPEGAGAMGLALDVMQECLDVLPDDLPYERYDGKPSWLEVGMAIHAETEGGEEGFQLWDTWSSRSPKYTTEEYGRARWDSFGRREGRGITGRSLIKWANAHGARVDLSAAASTADFEALVEQARENTEHLMKPIAAAVAEARWRVQNIGAFAARPAPTWLIKGLLPRAELVVCYGASGSGKSFLVLDLAWHIASGIDWRGMRTRAGRVVYVVAEGAGGFALRAHALSVAWGVQLHEIPLDILDGAPNLLQRADALDICKAIGRADVVVIDTFAASTPGANENTSEDIGLALQHVKGIHRATGATVILVHHSGKDATKGARGWSGLRAAVDAELEVVREPSGRSVRTTKQKDGADDGLWPFELKQVVLGTDEDGDPITSCVVVPVSMPALQGAPTPGEAPIIAARFGPVERIFIQAVDAVAGLSGGAPVESVLDFAMNCMPAPTGRDTRRQRLQRALAGLVDDGVYRVANGVLEII